MKCCRPLVNRLCSVCVCARACACAHALHVCSSTSATICSCFPVGLDHKERESCLGGPAPRAEVPWCLGIHNLGRFTLHSFILRRHHSVPQEKSLSAVFYSTPTSGRSTRPRHLPRAEIQWAGQGGESWWGKGMSRQRPLLSPSHPLVDSSLISLTLAATTGLQLALKCYGSSGHALAQV